MYKIMLADNEGVVLDALHNMIYRQYGENCDIRQASTAGHARRLSRKFLPDIAIINVEMPGMHDFDIVKEIRSFHLRCVFITVSTYDRKAYRAEAASLNVQAHLSKPLFERKVMPAVERAIRLVSGNQVRQEKSQHIQEKLDAVVPILEQGFINRFFFNTTSDSLSEDKALENYKELLNFPQDYGQIIQLSFGELPENVPPSALRAGNAKDVLQNPIGSDLRLQRQHQVLCRMIKEVFPLAIIGSVMSNHIFFLLPYWKPEADTMEKKELEKAINELLEMLNTSMDGIGFAAATGEIKNLADIHLPEDF